MGAKSKWSKYDDQIVELYREDETLSYTSAARHILGEDCEYSNIDRLRTYIRRLVGKHRNNDYSLDENNEGYTDFDDFNAFQEYCKREGLPLESVKSAKYINHNGQQIFNVALDFDENDTDQVDWAQVRDYIKDTLKIEFTTSTVKSKLKRGGHGVLKISDLHLGAYVDNLIRTEDFNINSLTSRLDKAVQLINAEGFDKVTVHILGDLIESFTGLNHMNSWKGLAKGMHGAEAVKLVTQILAKMLSEINNLHSVKIVAGNHDRVTAKNDEDVEGGAANLVSWGLTLHGYEVEFNSIVIKDNIDGICHILTHGHHGISKMTTKELCWEYGEQGLFNYISEGHLHSRIEKLSSKKNFSVVKDDSVDHKRVILPSLFTGNFYSESNAWTSNAGIHIVFDNGNGKPNTFDFSV